MSGDRLVARLNVNTAWVELEIEPRRTLADALRHDLGLVGTHLGCEHGICGSCTVLVDGQPARSCLLFTVQVDGSTIETVESLAADGTLNALQQAFAAKHALQCGFCTPGFLMLGTALLRHEPVPTRTRITEVVSANLCRCTGYTGIVDAIETAARGEEI